MTFASAYAGTKSTYMYAAGSSQNSGWQNLGSWTVTSSSATVTAVSTTPNAGSGATQNFALQYSDSLGATDLSTTWVWFTANFSGSSANSCMLYYARASNQLNLLNDAGSAWMPGTPGASGTISNSQCSVNLASATVGLSGANLTLTLPVTFTASYVGTKSIYMFAAGSSQNSGWQNLGSWTVTSSAPVVSAVSVTPNAGTGTAQSFALHYSDSAGVSDLATVWVWFTANFSGSSANSCMLYYVPGTNQLNLLNNAGSAWMPGTRGTSGTLSNSQCSVNLAASTVTSSGTDLTLNLPMTFTSAYSGAKSTYMYAAGSNANSGWQNLGSWTVPAGAPSPILSIVSTHAGSFTQGQTGAAYSLTVSNQAGAGATSGTVTVAENLPTGLTLSSMSGTGWNCGSNVCTRGDALAAGSSYPAIAVSVNVAGNASSPQVNSVTVSGGGAATASGTDSTVIQASSATVTAVSTTPNAGSGATQSFALQYSDSLGTADLSTTWVWFTANFSGSSANSCMFYYARAANQLNLLNDAGSAWMPGTPGTSGTLSNSQCSVNLASATVGLSGANLTLTLPVTFNASYAGTKSIFMYAAGSSQNSGWQNLGSWTVAAPQVSAVSVTPNAGTGFSQSFALHYADTFSGGASDLATAWVWFTANFSGSAANSCMLYYVPGTNQLNLLNDAGAAWMPGTPGSGGTLANSQCSVSLASSNGAASGSNLTLTLPVTFSGSYAGAKSIYMFAAGSSANSGWQNLGTWTP
jgi:hypothetical protein